MSVTDELTPTVRYELYSRSAKAHPWVRVDRSFAGLDLELLAGARIMPEFCLFPAVLATWLNDNDIQWGDWQLRALAEKTGHPVAIATIQERF